MKPASILALLLSLSPPLTGGETFYVSPAGDDAAAGTSEATPWKTVAKVNAAALAPGDTIAFQRGGVWQESLQPAASGTAEAPITFTAYGEGELPRFDGSDELAVAGLRIDTGAPFSAVLLDGAFLRTPQDWTAEGSTLVLPRELPSGAKLRVVRRENAVSLQGLRHLVLKYLHADATAKMHGGYGFRIEGCEDVLVEDCLATRGGKHHFGVINSTGVTLRRCRASLVMPDQGRGGASAFVSYSDHRRMGDTSLYEDCVVEDYADAPDGKGMYPAFVTHGEGIGRVEIVRLVSLGAGLTFNNLESGAELILRESRIEDAEVGIYGKNCLVRILELRRGVLTLGGEGNRIEYARLLDLNPGFAGYQAAIVNTGTKNVLENCEVVLDPAAKPFNAALALVSPESALTWRRCAFRTPSCVVRVLFPDVRAAGCVAEGNAYPADATFHVKGVENPLDLAAWREFGLDAE